MTAVAVAVPDNGSAAEVESEIAASEAALDALVKRSVRLHRSNIEHDPIRCIACFELR